jgi:hypothetical protein
MIKAGDVGQEVRDWQKRLSQLGYNVTIDGSFGPETLKQTILFQRQHGLTDDGVVGAKTYAAALAWAPPVVTALHSAITYDSNADGFCDEAFLVDCFDRNGKVVGRLRVDAAKAYNAMVLAAAKDGVTLVPTSSVDMFRPQWVYKTKAAIKKIAAGIMAKPGRSRHNKGIAVDFDLSKKGAEAWLHANAHKFGWAWGERRDEPWHWHFAAGV